MPIELINGSSRPNSRVVFLLKRLLLKVQTLRRIEPGEELSTDPTRFDLETKALPRNSPGLELTPSCRR